MKPPVLVYTLDCLRYGSVSDSTAPFIESLPLQWSRCYSSGTWTLPSHASLYSGKSPMEHGTTRPGDKLSSNDAVLPRKAKEAGYRTAIFSENPTFSSQTGFGQYIDDTHDDIHQKLLQSTFSAFGYVDEITPKEAISLMRVLLTRPQRFRNILNTVFSIYLQFYQPDSQYPHNGQRVFSHLSSYLQEESGPILAITNVLDPHDPYHGTPPGVNGERDPKELKALRDGDDIREFVLKNREPPASVQREYTSWEQYFQAKERIYEEYISEADRLLSEWRKSQSEIFEKSLVLVLGDHGQLFGAEGQLGHHTSLHPHGIHVPLTASPPKNWDQSQREINAPVSIAGLGQTLAGVCSGQISSTTGFLDAIIDFSQDSAGVVITCADGPTWDMESLYENDDYQDFLVDGFAVRKVARIQKENVDVFQSNWDSEEIVVSSYTYTENERHEETAPSDPRVDDMIGDWLREEYSRSDEHRDIVDSRLSDLGYI